MEVAKLELMKVMRRLNRSWIHNSYNRQPPDLLINFGGKSGTLALASWAFARVGVHRLSLRLPYLGVFYSLFFL